MVFIRPNTGSLQTMIHDPLSEGWQEPSCLSSGEYYPHVLRGNQHLQYGQLPGIPEGGTPGAEGERSPVCFRDRRAPHPAGAASVCEAAFVKPPCRRFLTEYVKIKQTIIPGGRFLLNRE